METTRRIAEYAVASSYERLPPEVVTAAKRCLLDWLGVGLAGSVEPASSILLQAVKDSGGRRQASILGKAMMTSTLNAALVNSAMSHVLDYDDTYAHVHSSSTLFPAIFAIAEKGHLGGKEVLSAFIPGFELEARLAEVIGDPFLARGLHPTASLGAFGAAASAGKLLGLTTDQMVNALGIALTKVSGAVAALGTMAKCLQIGSSATNGLLAARLAQQGFTGPAAALEGEKGFFRVYLSAPQPQNFAADLGQSYRVTRDCFKLHACCRATHAAVDAALALRREHEIKPADVVQIDYEGWDVGIQFAGNPRPWTGLEGKFSVQYCTSAALADGHAGAGQFTDARVRTPDLQELTRKVKTIPNSTFDDRHAIVAVKTRDGSTYQARTERLRGDPDSPLTWEELEGKFRGLAGSVLSPDKVDRMAGLVAEFETLDDINALTRLWR